MNNVSIYNARPTACAHIQLRVRTKHIPEFVDKVPAVLLNVQSKSLVTAITGDEHINDNVKAAIVAINFFFII